MTKIYRFLLTGISINCLFPHLLCQSRAFPFMGKSSGMYILTVFRAALTSTYIHGGRGAIIIGMLLGASGYVQAAVVNDIRMWHAPERSRIVFDMDKRVTFNVFTLKNPSRVVIDLPNTKLQNSVPASGTMGQFIKQLRLGYPQPETMRLVFDLNKPVRYFIQLLRPVDKYKYRLVVDYYHQDSVVEADQIAAPGMRKIPQQQRKRKPTLLVLIDPGHGGEDSGALGQKTQEKNIVLAIAKKLKTQIDKQPGLRAELTRTGDYYVGLRKRTRIARHRAADLFVSIHADAVENKKVRGASVYALSPHGASSETAKQLADKENASDLFGGVSLADKDDTLAYTLLDLSMKSTVSNSIRFGQEVLAALGRVGRLHSKRVEQAGFVVLKSPDIPSILVETAYITNPADEKLLLNSQHQYRIVNGMVVGIKRYVAKNQHYFVN